MWNEAVLIARNTLRISSLLVFAALLIFLEMILPYFYNLYFGTYEALNNYIYFLSYTYVCLLLVPYLVCTHWVKLTASDLGLQFPELTIKNIMMIVIAMGLLVPFSYIFSKQQAFQQYYSFGHISLLKFTLFQIFLLPCYYFAEEFFFRGFLFLSLWRLTGWHSFWITDIIFAYAHMFKPLPEIFLSIPASVIFNYLTLKTKSFYPAILVHGTLGIMLNVMVYTS
jgi:membrane protease YdiL (CAAX protease family)